MLPPLGTRRSYLKHNSRLYINQHNSRLYINQFFPKKYIMTHIKLRSKTTNNGIIVFFIYKYKMLSKI